MKLRICTALVIGVLGITLAACGSGDETAGKVEDPKQVEKGANEEEGTGLEALKGKDLESMTAEDWEKVNLSKKQFDEWLSEMEKPDESGEIMINKAEMTDDKTISIVFNNSDGDTFENTMTAPIFDAFIRQIYKHSKYFKDEEPTVVFSDLTGYKIAEISEPINFNESGETSGQDLGTFKIGDKVDVAGTVITINNVSFTDERNQFDEYKPAEVLKIDLTVQNATQEELHFDVYEFELYDAEGTKMDFVSLDNMSETLQPGKNASGSAYIGTSGKGPYELYYIDFMTDAKAMWNIDIK
ncbi:DUF4352 domain-containing protein [Schinkia azotoformans]|uniref:DUF4352 domain-containing protein n=1 Tax=Schinkia azotoformans TaxID=1454 RepID=UPI002DBB34F9|nr:DUF4352 domain-containing protein [Schinkia azotoformans]MEC1744163.1 DUF4352 domain-containing protein [Schinkia azotoformans]